MPYSSPRLAALVIDLAKIQEITKLLVNTNADGFLPFSDVAEKNSAIVLEYGAMKKNTKPKTNQKPPLPYYRISQHAVVLLKVFIVIICEV